MVSPRRGAGDRAQAVPLLIGIVAVAAVCLVALARFAAGSVDAARARTAADAAALAGAAGGRPDADAMAVRNGGRLLSFAVAGADVIVRVAWGRAVATARATMALVRPPP